MRTAPTRWSARNIPHDMGTLEKTWDRAKRTGRYSKFLGGFYAQRLWFTPWPTYSGEGAERREREWLTHTTPLTMEVGGHSLSGFTAGRGPTVLLVHGWGEHASRLGGLVAPLVAAGFRCVAMDLPAHGRGATGSTDVYELSSAISAVSAELGGVDGIVAHSMGVTATAVAIAEGGLACRALVGVAVPTMRIEDAFERFAGLLGLPDRTMAGLRSRIERRYGRDVWHATARVLERDHGVPAFVVHDRDDPLVPLEDAYALAQAWNARLRVTEGLGHAKILYAEPVVEDVVRFLTSTIVEDADGPVTSMDDRAIDGP